MIFVLNNNLKQALVEMGMMADIDTEAEWMQGIVDKQLKDRKATEEIYNQVMTEKLFGFLESKFAVNMHEVPLEEFLKAPSKHHHHH